jgi:hypothetical protein
MGNNQEKDDENTINILKKHNVQLVKEIDNLREHLENRD